MTIEFVQNNILLIAVALVSGGMLVWPFMRRTTGGPSVDVTRATHMMNREEALVVDVREPGEYGAGHILGAKNVPLASIDAGAGELAKKKARPIIVYCDTSNRSARAVAALKRLGFERVVNLSGGIGAWQQAGLPVEK